MGSDKPVLRVLPSGIDNIQAGNEQWSFPEPVHLEEIHKLLMIPLIFS
jgi:hypothetical protein